MKQLCLCGLLLLAGCDFTDDHGKVRIEHKPPKFDTKVDVHVEVPEWHRPSAVCRCCDGRHRCVCAPGNCRCRCPKPAPRNPSSDSPVNWPPNTPDLHQ